MEEACRGLRVRSLSSGSDGNCFLVCFDGAAVLIDAGVSTRAVVAGLAAEGIPEESVRAVLITHEHADHVRSLAPIARRLKAPIIANRATLNHLLPPVGAFRTAVLTTGDEMEVAGLGVRSFSVSHDAAEPVGYVLRYGGWRVGYATDTGEAGDGLRQHLLGVDLAVIEANHDVALLLAGPYPPFLKERILSVRGHLSNNEAAQLALDLVTARPRSEIWLGHLSATNNTPHLALATVQERLAAAGYPTARVRVAPRGCRGPLWKASC
ncbi:MAG: MBL fold metallo-hydrolase [Armatimonadota bacterium]|nr:MBL fold metallo-hydrolase [Armatimonadota bacterium]